MEPITLEALDRFLQVLGERVPHPLKLYLLGGSALRLLGSPRMTLDLDYDLDPASAKLEKFISALADELNLDLEFVPLGEFIPLPPQAEQRHRFVGRYGKVDVFIFDLYSIALSKIARGFEADLEDVVFLLASGLIDFHELERAFGLILPEVTKADIIPSEFIAFFEEIRRRMGQ